MTLDRPPASAPRDGLPTGPRLLVGLPLAALAGFVCLVALSLTGWGFETEPLAQLARDLPLLVVSALAGALCLGIAAWALRGLRPAPVLAAAALGILPALLRVSAYLTDRY